MSLRYALLGLAAAVPLLGCEAKHYRTETVVNADGSIDRAVYQPADDTPADAQSPKLWSTLTYAARIEQEQFSGKIADLPRSARDDDHPYLAAWGHFDSAEKLPRTFLQQTAPGLPRGELKLSHRREDYGLVVEHTWQETLTDVVTLEDMQVARRELADLLIPLARRILEEGLGDEYDVSLLIEWMEATGKTWLVDLTEALFSTAASRTLRGEAALASAFYSASARHGLELRDPAGRPLEEPLLGQAVQAYAVRVVSGNIRRRDGEPVPAEVISGLLQWIGLQPGESPAGERFEEARKRAIDEVFGGPEAFEDALRPLVVRIFGAYFNDLLGNKQCFHYTLDLPGDVVETNGTLLADRRVRWTFRGFDAYPFGYPMTCRALVVHPGARGLLGSNVLEDREAALRFVAIAQADVALSEALRASAADQSLAPLYALRDKLAAARDDGKAYEELWALLKLPAERPPR